MHTKHTYTHTPPNNIVWNLDNSILKHPKLLLLFAKIKSNKTKSERRSCTTSVWKWMRRTINNSNNNNNLHWQPNNSKKIVKVKSKSMADNKFSCSTFFRKKERKKRKKFLLVFTELRPLKHITQCRNVTHIVSIIIFSKRVHTISIMFVQYIRSI